MTSLSDADLDEGWICPDCTIDLDNVRHHPVGWRFCPYSGRPAGMLHITPTKLQRQWNDLVASMRAVYRSTGEAFLMGLLSEYAKRADTESYISGDEGPVLFQWDTVEQRNACELGQDVAAFLDRAVEWRTHMIGLSSGARGLQGTEGRKALKP